MRRSDSPVTFEPLDSRLMMSADPSVKSILIMLGSGNDSLSVHVSEYVDTRVVSWTLNGVSQQHKSPFYEQVAILDFGGNDTIEVLGGPIGVTFNILAGSGNDTLKTSASLRGRINFDGNAGSDKVIVDQTYHDDPENMKIQSDRIEWGPYRYVAFGAVERIEVKGSDVADTIDVGYINSDQTVVVHGGKGDDTISVGRGDMDSNINGRLSVNGDAGTDKIVFYDTLDTGNDAYRVDWVSATKPGLMPFEVEYSAEKIDLLANHYSNRIEAPRSIAQELRIFGAKGDDRILLGSTSLALLRNTRIHVDGGAGSDRLVLEDSGDIAHRSHTLTASVYGRQGSQAVTFASNETIELRAGSGNNLINASTATASLLIRGGAGNDTIFGSAGNDQIWGDAGNDSILAGAGNDFVVGGEGDDFIDGGSGSNLVYQ